MLSNLHVVAHHKIECLFSQLTINVTTWLSTMKSCSKMGILWQQNYRSDYLTQSKQNQSMRGVIYKKGSPINDIIPFLTFLNTPSPHQYVH